MTARAPSPPERAALAPTPAADARRLSDAFWTSFHAAHWERRAATFAQPMAGPLCTPAELFDAVVEASDRHRAGEPAKLMLCVDGAQQLADVGRHLPERADGSLDAWGARVRRLFGGRRFGLVVEHVQAFHADVALRLLDTLGGLIARIGLPTESKATAFIGDYAATPFGLHRGNSGTLVFVVQGPKRVRTWPDAYFAGGPNLTGTLDYHAHDGESIVLQGDAGDLLYWPSDHWHIGEAVDGQLSASVNVHLFMERDAEGALLAHALPAFRRRLRALPADATDGALLDALAETAADPALVRELGLSRLRHASALGFTHLPAPAPVPSSGDDAVVRGRVERPIQWMALDADRLAVAANGHAFGLTRSALAIRLLERLNTGEPASVAELASTCSGVSDGVTTSPDAVRGVLAKLASMRAVEIVDAQGAVKSGHG